MLRINTRLTLNQDMFRYTLRIYPTDDADKCHNDFFPLIVTLAVELFFFMTAAVLYLYDATRHSVRPPLCPRSSPRMSAISSCCKPPVQGNATKLRFLADHRKKGQEEGINRPNLVDLSSGPIADLFPNCTGELHVIARDRAIVCKI